MQFKSDDGSREFFAKWKHGVRAMWMPRVSAIVNKDCVCASFGHAEPGPKHGESVPTKFSVFVRWWRPEVVAFVNGRRVVSWNW